MEKPSDSSIQESLFKCDIPQSSLWHRSHTETILELARGTNQCDKRLRNKLLEEKGLPLLLPWLIRQFSSSAQISSRYKAIMSVFAGLNYSLYVLQLPERPDVEGLIHRDSCERLHCLLIGLLGVLFQKLRGQTIFDIMTSKSNQVYEMDDSAETLSYVLQESVVIHFRRFFDPLRNLLMRESMAAVLKGWRTSLLMRPVMPIQSLCVLDSFISRYLKRLVDCQYSDHHSSPSYNHILGLIHADLLNFIPVSVRAATLKPKFSYVSDPVKLSAMIVCQMVKILLKARDDTKKSVAILQDVIKDLVKFTETQDIVGTDKAKILNICKLVEVFVRFLERKPFSNNPSSPTILVDENFGIEILHWIRNDMIDDMLVRAILLPVLGQVCIDPFNESGGFSIIEMLSKEPQLQFIVSSWLISNIKPAVSSSHFPFRSFCLNSLNYIYTEKRKFANLFQVLSEHIEDKSYAFRAQVSMLLGLYGFHHMIRSRSHAIHYVNSCSFQNSTGSQNLIELTSPYGALLHYFDSFWESRRKCGKLERQSIGLWCMSATEHLIFKCPLFLKYDPTLSRMKFQFLFVAELRNRYITLTEEPDGEVSHSLRKVLAVLICSLIESNLDGEDKLSNFPELKESDTKLQLLLRLRIDKSWKVRLLVLRFIITAMNKFNSYSKGHVIKKNLLLLLKVAYYAPISDQYDQHYYIRKCLDALRIYREILDPESEIDLYPIKLCVDDGEVLISRGRSSQAVPGYCNSVTMISTKNSWASVTNDPLEALPEAKLIAASKTYPSEKSLQTKHSDFVDCQNLSLINGIVNDPLSGDASKDSNSAHVSASKKSVSMLYTFSIDESTNRSLAQNQSKQDMVFVLGDVTDRTSMTVNDVHSGMSDADLKFTLTEQNPELSYQILGDSRFSFDRSSYMDLPMDINELSPPSPICQNTSSLQSCNKKHLPFQTIVEPIEQMAKAIPSNEELAVTASSTYEKGGSQPSKENFLKEGTQNDIASEKEINIQSVDDAVRVAQEFTLDLSVKGTGQGHSTEDANATSELYQNNKDICKNSVMPIVRPLQRRYSAFKKAIFTSAALGSSRDKNTNLKSVRSSNQIERADDELDLEEDSACDDENLITSKSPSSGPLEYENSNIDMVDAVASAIPVSRSVESDAVQTSNEKERLGASGNIRTPVARPLERRYSTFKTAASPFSGQSPFKSLGSCAMKSSNEKDLLPDTPIKEANVQPGSRPRDDDSMVVYSTTKPSEVWSLPIKKGTSLSIGNDLPILEPLASRDAQDPVEEIGTAEDSTGNIYFHSRLDMNEDEMGDENNLSAVKLTISRPQERRYTAPMTPSFTTSVPKSLTGSDNNTDPGDILIKDHNHKDIIMSSLGDLPGDRDIDGSDEFGQRSCQSKKITSSVCLLSPSQLNKRIAEKFETSNLLSRTSPSVSSSSLGNSKGHYAQLLSTPLLSSTVSKPPIIATSKTRAMDGSKSPASRASVVDSEQHLSVDPLKLATSVAKTPNSKDEIPTTLHDSPIIGAAGPAHISPFGSSTFLENRPSGSDQMRYSVEVVCEPELPKKVHADPVKVRDSVVVYKRDSNVSSLLSISGKHEVVLQRVLQHLVFTKTNQKTFFSYADLVPEKDLHLGSTYCLSTLNKTLDATRKPTSIFEFTEGLHYLLKKSFSLDLSLLVDWSKTMSLDGTPLKESDHLSSNEARWVYCLSQIHEHCLPLSRILFSMEEDLKAPLSVAQALILIKDQVALVHSTLPSNSESGHREQEFLDCLLRLQT